MRPGERHAGHAHDSWHLLVVEDGGFEEAQGDGSFHVSGGQLRLSPAGLGHTLHVGAAGAACRNIHLRDKALTRRLGRLFGHSHVRLEAGEDPPDAERGLAGELDLYAYLARLCRGTTGDDRPLPAWLREARIEIEGSDTRICALAERFRVSREHFSRQYADAFGCSPVAARQISATLRATSLILETDAALSEIAIEAGFCDQSHMCRAIRARTGSSPRSLRPAA